MSLNFPKQVSLIEVMEPTVTAMCPSFSLPCKTSDFVTGECLENNPFANLEWKLSGCYYYFLSYKIIENYKGWPSFVSPFGECNIPFVWWDAF